jgi:hypothetical protein
MLLFEQTTSSTSEQWQCVVLWSSVVVVLVVLVTVVVVVTVVEVTVVVDVTVVVAESTSHTPSMKTWTPPQWAKHGL